MPDVDRNRPGIRQDILEQDRIVVTPFTTNVQDNDTPLPSFEEGDIITPVDHFPQVREVEVKVNGKYLDTEVLINEQELDTYTVPLSEHSQPILV